jgi:4-hydroxybenzoate polyprenyltransferase
MSPSTTSNAGSSVRSALLGWGRLLRLSLTATAAADVVAGAVFEAGGWPGWGRIWLPILASLCVYHGGLVLNDWADAEQDFDTRPGRPIPSGAVAPEAALAVAVALLALGPLLANWYSGKASVLLAAVSIFAAVYDLAGRGPWTGPLLLGLCRAGNLLAGMIAFGPPTSAGTCLAAGYGAYVFLISRLGRMEDGDEARIGMRPRTLLVGAGVCQLVPLAVGLTASAAIPATAPVAAGLLGWIGLRTRSWSRGTVLEAMGSALRLLLFYSASVAWAGGGPLIGLALLAAGYPLAWLLRQVFPPS